MLPFGMKLCSRMLENLEQLTFFSLIFIAEKKNMLRNYNNEYLIILI